MQQSADDGHQHPKLRQMHTAFGGLRMAHPFEAKDEKNRSQQVTEFDEVKAEIHLMVEKALNNRSHDPRNYTNGHEMALVSFRVVSWIVFTSSLPC